MKKVQITFTADVQDDFFDDQHTWIDKLESFTPYRIYNPSYREIEIEKLTEKAS